MKTAFEELMTGLDEVEAFLAGERKGFKVHVPDKVDVKSIRNKLNMTQSRFSNTFGFSLDAIKHWEGGTTHARSASPHAAYRDRQESGRGHHRPSSRSVAENNCQGLCQDPGSGTAAHPALRKTGHVASGRTDCRTPQGGHA